VALDERWMAGASVATAMAPAVAWSPSETNRYRMIAAAPESGVDSGGDEHAEHARLNAADAAREWKRIAELTEHVGEHDHADRR
jgi:hypothetical protein